MKKFLVFVVAILALSVASCKKDKNETSNPFVGTWKLQESTANGVDSTTDCERKSTMVITEKKVFMTILPVKFVLQMYLNLPTHTPMEK